MMTGVKRPYGASVRATSRARERAVDHVHRVLQSVDRHERAEARAFFLAEQDLVEHVEPIERDAGLAVAGLDLAARIEERLAPADLVDQLLDLLGTRIGGKLRERVAQIHQGGA